MGRLPVMKIVNILILVLLAFTGVSWAQICGAPANNGGAYLPFAANATLTGTDTISLSTGNQKLTLPTSGTSATETLTIQKGALSPAASALNVFVVQFLICQNTGGNVTLTFAAGSGITNFEWTVAGSTSATVGQPGYTLTAGNGDWYTCTFDNTNLKCSEVMSNQPC